MSQVPDSVHEVASHWVRFVASEPAMVLESALEVHAAPDQPANWALTWVVLPAADWGV